LYKPKLDESQDCILKYNKCILRCNNIIFRTPGVKGEVIHY